MDFGVIFANTGPRTQPDDAVAMARAAEDAGFDSLWTVEHVVVPAAYQSPYPYSKSGRMPGTEDAPIPDPLIWLTYVAAATTRIKLATGILILPQRNPVVLAKEAATLDVLSKGRLILGIGGGWLREEFEAIGIPFAARAARTDEYAAARRALWTEAESTHSGRFASFERAQSYPKPVRPGGIPVVVGGHTEAAARRAGRLGDGFFLARATPEELTHLLDVMRAAADEAGRDAAAIVGTCRAGLDVDPARRYQDLGVHRLVVPPLGEDRDKLERFLSDFGENVIRAVR